MQMKPQKVTKSKGPDKESSLWLSEGAAHFK